MGISNFGIKFRELKFRPASAYFSSARIECCFDEHHFNLLCRRSIIENYRELRINILPHILTDI